MQLRLKHIKSVRVRLADGQRVTYNYHRRTGKRIHGTPGTPEFLDSYKLASQNTPDIAPGTIHALVVDYRQSIEFTALTPVTQSNYQRYLDRIVETFGSAPLRVFEDVRIRRNIKQWRDGIAKDAPRAADIGAMVLGRLLQWGYNQGDLSINHGHRLGRAYQGSRADRIWTDADVAAFLAYACPTTALALRLALDTGQRQGDLLRLKWSAYDGQAITLTQSKTGATVFVPCTMELQAALAATERHAVTIITGQSGRALSKSGFAKAWRKVAKVAGIHGRLTFHDLRGTAVTRLAEAGCTAPQIAAVSGHSLTDVDRILETYMARTPELASAAITNLEHARRTKVTNEVTNATTRKRLSH